VKQSVGFNRLILCCVEIPDSKNRLINILMYTSSEMAFCIKNMPFMVWDFQLYS